MEKLGDAERELIIKQEQVWKTLGVIVDEVLDAQKNIVKKYLNIIVNESNLRKGNFGEIASDVLLSNKGYEPLHTRITDIDAPSKQGIDGVFKKGNEYFIVEAKYKGTATLGNTADGKQMSNAWIFGSNRLENAVGATIADDIRTTGFRKILAEVAPDGSIVYKELDASANVSRIFTP